MTRIATPLAASAVILAAAAVALAGCGGGQKKQDDARMQELGNEVAQLSAKVKAQDQKIATLGTAEKAVPLAASTQSGPDNTVVAQCPPGAYLFRLPRTPSEGGEALCRPLAAPTAPDIKGR